MVGFEKGYVEVEY